MNQQVNKSAGNPNWKPGKSGNPDGRPPGSRQKIAEKLLSEFVATLETPEAAESLRRLS